MEEAQRQGDASLLAITSEQSERLPKCRSECNERDIKEIDRWVEFKKLRIENVELRIESAVNNTKKIKNEK